MFILFRAYNRLYKKILQLLSEVKNLPKFDTPFISDREKIIISNEERLNNDFIIEQQNRWNGGFDPELALQMALENHDIKVNAAENMEMTKIK